MLHVHAALPTAHDIHKRFGKYNEIMGHVCPSQRIGRIQDSGFHIGTIPIKLGRLKSLKLQGMWVGMWVTVA